MVLYSLFKFASFRIHSAKSSVPKSFYQFLVSRFLGLKKKFVEIWLKKFNVTWNNSTFFWQIKACLICQFVMRSMIVYGYLCIGFLVIICLTQGKNAASKKNAASTGTWNSHTWLRCYTISIWEESVPVTSQPCITFCPHAVVWLTCNSLQVSHKSFPRRKVTLQSCWRIYFTIVGLIGFTQSIITL